MRRTSNVRMGGTLLFGGAALLLCACGPTAGTAAVPHSNRPTTSPSSQPANTGSSQFRRPPVTFCSTLAVEQKQVGGLANAVSRSESSTDMTALKNSLESFVAGSVDTLANVEAEMASAPANVQAAVTVLDQFFTQARTATKSATNLTQLKTAVASLLNDQVNTASATLTDYSNLLCRTASAS